MDGRDPRTGQPPVHVRLVYHYTDGHDFVTDSMLRTEALAYMPVLHATRVDDGHYHASFADIELRVAEDRGRRTLDLP